MGLVVAGGTIEAPSGVPPLSELEAAALLILYAFVGFENSVIPAGETSDPTPQHSARADRHHRRHGPALLPRPALLRRGDGAGRRRRCADGRVRQGADGPGRRPAARRGGGLLAARQHQRRDDRNDPHDLCAGPRRAAPRLVRPGQRRFATPANSILFMGGLIALLALSGSFVWLAVVSTLARMFVYSISIARCAEGRPRRSRRQAADLRE